MSDKNVLKYLGLVTELGLMAVICIGGGLLLGVWLDKKLGTRALFTILLLLLGIGAAFVRVYQMVAPKASEKKEDQKDK